MATTLDLTDEERKAVKAAVAKAKAGRVFSGIQPTGALHVGHYLGAVRTWRQLVEEGNDETLFCIADTRAITADYDPLELRKTIDTFALDLVACGLDLSMTTLFVQSDVREHTELAWYLAAVSPPGDLDRATQLTTADILLYKATVVPVGEDQVPRVESARETVRRVNRRFKRLDGSEIFVEPKPRLSSTPSIKGLDGESSMSSSKGSNAIDLFEPKESFWNKLRTAAADPKRLQASDPCRPEVCNVYTMHKAVSPLETQSEVYANCTGARWSCDDCKKALFESFDKELVPLRAKRESLKLEEVRQQLGDGAAKARRIAQDTMKEVREAMGLGSLAGG